MPILDKINEQIKQAMKDKDVTMLDTLRSLKTALKNKQVELMRDLDEGESLQVIQREAKTRRESIEQFREGGREDLVAKEEAQLKIIDSFLPAEMSDAEIEEKAKAVIAELGASTKKEAGKVMSKLMAELKGRADGKRINAIVGKLLD
jgi:hypothetical protein